MSALHFFRLTGESPLFLLAAALAFSATTASADPTRLFAPAAPPARGTAARAVVRGAVFARLAPDAWARTRSPRHLELSRPTCESPMSLTLDRFEPFTPGARVGFTDDAGPHAVPADVACFRGHVVGDSGSTVVLTFGPRGAMGLVEARGRHWAIAPVADDLHRIVDESQAPAPTTPLRCGMDEAEVPPPPAALYAPAARAAVAANTNRYLCKLAIDCDYEWTADRFGGDRLEALQYVVTMFAAISTIYERDVGTTIRISYFNEWTTPNDPYTMSPASAELPEFASWWNANMATVDRTIAHLVSGRNLNGGYSYIGGLCNGSGYGVTSTNGTDGLPNNVTSRDVWLLAHEVGHEFGSYHTQNCSWATLGYIPAGTLLDSCYTAEGGCYSGPVGIVPFGKGTIMSYCDQLTGGSQSNDRLIFHPVCALLMRASVEAATCMTTMTIQPPPALAVTAAGSSAHLSWTASPTSGVTGYEVLRSSWQEDFSAEVVGSTSGTTFDDPVPWSTFYYRVRAIAGTTRSVPGSEVAFNRCPLVRTGLFPAGTRPAGMATGDFNGDGRLDLAVTQNGIGRTGIVLGNGDGTFASPVTYFEGVAPAAVVVSDFNGDGIPDLAVAVGGANGVAIHLGHGTAGAGDGTFGFATIYPSDLFPQDLVAGDFDEDGIVDLAVANTNAGTVTILRGQGEDGVGDGTFASPVAIPQSIPGVRALASGDFDGDGITDLVALNSDGPHLLLGNGTGGRGDGTFRAGMSLDGGIACYALAAADLDGDDALDLVVVNFLDNNSRPYLSVFRGNGDGTFAARQDYPTCPLAQSVAIADWTGDGILDVAVCANGGYNGILVYPGLPGGGLGGPTILNLGYPIRSLASGDFDGDGVVDLVAANNFSSTLSMMRTSCDRERMNGATVVAPNGGETWTVGSERTLAWARDPGCALVNLDLSRDGGATWEPLARRVSGTTWSWTVTPPASNTVKLRVTNADVATAGDRSDTTFAIVPGAALDVPPASLPTALAIRRVAPNPLHGAIHAELALPCAAPATLKLIDTAGRIVASRPVVAAARVAHVEWNMPRLSPGVYILRLEQAGSRAVAKVAVVP